MSWFQSYPQEREFSAERQNISGIVAKHDSNKLFIHTSLLPPTATVSPGTAKSPHSSSSFTN